MQIHHRVSRPNIYIPNTIEHRTQMSVKVAVVGATGRTGSDVVALLVQRCIPVRALVRSKEKADKLLPTSSPFLELVQGELGNKLQLRELLIGCDTVIITSGALSIFGLSSNTPEKVDYEGVKNLVEAAPRETLKHIILVSTVGTAQIHSRVISFALEYFGGQVMKWKAKGEELVRNSGFNYTIIRAAILRGSSLDPAATKLFEPMIVDQTDTIDGSTERRDLALLCVTAAQNPQSLPSKCTFEVVRSTRKINATNSEPSDDPFALFAHLHADIHTNPAPTYN